MALIPLLTSMFILAAPLSPTGDAETVKWGRKASGHLLGDAGITYTVSGPTVVVLELRGAKDLKNQTVEVTVTRDGTHVSKNTLTFKKKGRGPKEFPTLANLGFSVPDGEHSYVVTAATPLALLATTSKKLKKKIAAAPEEALPAPAPAPEPEPVAEATPEPPPAADPEPTAAPESESAAADPATEEPAVGGDEAVEAFAAIEASSAEAATQVATDMQTRGIRVAVYDLELQGVDPTIGAVVTDSVLAEIRKLQGVSAIGMDEIRDMLSHEANKQMLGCSSDDSCMAEIAGALGVDDLVTGSLSKAAESHVILLRRLDQNRAVVAGTYNKRLKAESGQEFLMAIGPGIEELYPDRQLREGAKRGVPDEVALRLDPPPLPVWSFWTVAGSAGAVAAAGGVFGLLAKNEQDRYNDLASDSVTRVVAGSELMATGKTLEQHAWTANGLFIASGALALAAAVMIPFVDWSGYGDEEE